MEQIWVVMSNQEKNEYMSILQDQLCYYKRKRETYQDRILSQENNMKKTIENMMFDYVCEKKQSLKEASCYEFLEYLTNTWFSTKWAKYIDWDTLSLKDLFTDE